MSIGRLRIEVNVERGILVRNRVMGVDVGVDVGVGGRNGWCC